MRGTGRRNLQSAVKSFKEMNFTYSRWKTNKHAKENLYTKH